MARFLALVLLLVAAPGCGGSAVHPAGAAEAEARAEVGAARAPYGDVHL